MVSVRRILLVSASPRRRALLEAAGYEIEVRASEADETWPGGDVEAAVIALARRKLTAVEVRDELALAADTEVILDGRALGKPTDPADAVRMLSELAGRAHQVVTGFCLRRAERWHQGAATTEVRFRPLRRAEIERYVETGEPMDKAGGYGIQGRGGALVDTVRGSYTNVIGLPLREVLSCADELLEGPR